MESGFANFPEMLCLQLPEILQKPEMSTVLLNSPVSWIIIYPLLRQKIGVKWKEQKINTATKCVNSQQIIRSFNLTFFDLYLKNSSKGLVSLLEKSEIN